MEQWRRDVLVHYGVKGMKWRKRHSIRESVKDMLDSPDYQKEGPKYMPLWFRNRLYKRNIAGVDLNPNRKNRPRARRKDVTGTVSSIRIHK